MLRKWMITALVLALLCTAGGCGGKTASYADRGGTSGQPAADQSLNTQGWDSGKATTEPANTGKTAAANRNNGTYRADSKGKVTDFSKEMPKTAAQTPKSGEAAQKMQQAADGMKRAAKDAGRSVGNAAEGAADALEDGADRMTR